jgi:hypothetical protein
MRPPVVKGKTDPKLRRKLGQLYDYFHTFEDLYSRSARSVEAREKFEAALARLPDVEPEDHDRL